MRQLNQPITGLDNGCILTFNFEFQCQWNKWRISGLDDSYIQIDHIVAWRHQAIFWTNRSLSSIRSREFTLG